MLIPGALAKLHRPSSKNVYAASNKYLIYCLLFTCISLGKMVNSCCVENCRNRSDGPAKCHPVSFYRIPNISEGLKDESDDRSSASLILINPRLTTL